jgi:methylthioribose-1-phosphate isomerase
MLKTIEWSLDGIRILDQTALPDHEIYLNLKTIDQLIDAIKKLEIRGAPALGIAGAYGMCLGLVAVLKNKNEDFDADVESTAQKLIASRPTAVNLRWGVDRIKKIIYACRNSDSLIEKAIEEAKQIHQEDLEQSRNIGQLGAKLITDPMSILTHCNTGGLATGGLGTALAVIFTAHRQNKKIHVYVDETRPLLQGMRLTSWELLKSGVDHTLIADNMAGSLMAQKKVGCVIVGADRIAQNGDTANKIGTYTLAVLCEKNAIPFYVAAPSSTIDLGIRQGSQIPIEERSPEEITHWHGRRMAPEGVRAYNPAFDVTPGSLITAIITDKKIFYGPYDFTNSYQLN